MQPQSTSSAELQEKQSYIIQNILQADYDIQQFATFLSKMPPYFTSNLNKAKFSVVKSAVKQFIQKSNPQIKYNKKQIQIVNKTQTAQKNYDSQYYYRNSQFNLKKINIPTKDTSNKNSKIQTNNKNNKDQKSNKFNQIENQNVNSNNSIKLQIQDQYLRFKKCIQQTNLFGLTSVNVEITSFKKNQGKFLSRDYITYQIQLNQLGKGLDRRYSDFQWLRNILEFNHPGLIVPPIPKKKRKKIFTAEHVKKKGRMLQCFLRKCLQIADLRADQCLYRFLTIDDPSKFQQFKQQNQPDKQLKSIEMQKLKTQKGVIQYGIMKQLTQQTQRGIRYFSQISPVLKNLYKQIKRIKQNLNACAHHFENFQIQSKKMKQLDLLFKKFTPQYQKNNFYNYLNILGNNFKQQMKVMSQIWEKEIYVKLKYEFHHSNKMEEEINDYKSLQKQFYSKKQELLKKKMRLYSKPMSQWQINTQILKKFQSMNPKFQQVAPYLLNKKSQQFFKVELKYALFTKQISDSVAHYRKNNNHYCMKNFQYFLNREYQGLNKWSQRLKQLISTQFSMKLNLMNSIFNNVNNVNTGDERANQYNKNNSNSKQTVNSSSSIQLKTDSPIKSSVKGFINNIIK